MKSTISEMIPIGYALRESLKNGYNLQKFKCDVIAALVVSLVALPLNMALAIAVGLPPQNGIYTAIAAGIAVPLLGGSMMQVSGPAAAFVVILAPITTQYGPRGLIITSIIAGLLVAFLGIAKLGRYINYVPYPVIIGFTAGIAITIGTIALNDFLGLNIESFQGEYIHKVALIVEHIPTLNWAEALVGVVTLASIIVLRRILPKVPPHIFAIGVGTLLAFALQQSVTVATLGSRFSYTLPNGETGRGVPPIPPTLHIPGLDPSPLFAWPTFQEIFPLILPALIVAALSALETLLSATAADGMAKTKHHPNAELVGIGIGNILSGLVGGFPASGVIARTTANINSGAKTPIASSLHGVILLIFMVSLAPFLAYIPMASLAAILVNVAYHMSHYKQFVQIIKVGPKSDGIVLLVCFTLTVLIDMVAGVTAGVVLACFLLTKRVANMTQSNVSHSSAGHHHKLKHVNLPDDVMVYHIDGPLFFGTVEQSLTHTSPAKTLIIDMEDVPFVDMTGLITMESMIADMQAKDMEIILCGNPQVTEKILQKLPSSVTHRMEVTETVDEGLSLCDAYAGAQR